MNQEHLAIVRMGAGAIGEWREDHSDEQLDISGSDLTGCELSEADLSGADVREANLDAADLIEARLNGTNFSGSNLSGADLRSTDLRKANLSRANLCGAYLRGANLGGANLSSGDLSRANLSSADLSGADLSGAMLDAAELCATDFRNARFSETILSHLDLSFALNLQSALHQRRSTVGIDTLYLSRGEIPESFLRGCGVPDELIAYIPALIGQPFQFYSVFISYSHTDKEFARRLHDTLQGGEASVAGWTSTSCYRATTSTRQSIAASDCGTRCCCAPQRIR